MPVEANLVTSNTAAIDLVPLIIKDELLQIADKDTVFYEIGDKTKIPEGEGKTVQFSRYERLPLPTAPLTEGLTPVDTPLTISAVQAVVDQWGAVVAISDVGIMTIKHPLLNVAQERLGTQYSELLDREIQKTLMGTTNVFFAGGKTSRANLAAGDNVAGDLIRQLVAGLRAIGAPKYDKKKYVGVVDTWVAMDIQKDPTFTNAAAYSNLMALLNAEIGDWLGVRWKESNLIPVLSLLASSAYTITTPSPSGAETGFATGASVPVTITQLDPVFGFETQISNIAAQTTGAPFNVSIQLNAAAPTGTYGIYVGLENAVVATLQQFFQHIAGNTDVLIFTKAGVPNGAGHFLTQATGPVAPTPPPAVGNVHISYIFGKAAFGCTELGRMQTFITPPTASDSDPLVQRRKVGYKALWKAVIKNTQFFDRIESLSAFN